MVDRHRCTVLARLTVFSAAMFFNTPSIFALDDDVVASAPTSEKTRPAAQKSATAIPDDVEAEVLQMVRTHLPPFEVLLDRLRQKQPTQYRVAVRDLARAHRRLQNAEKRGPDFYEIEVASVKTHFNVDLLVAKLKVRDNDADREALREAVEKLRLADLAKTKYELGMLETRLKRTQRAINEARQHLQNLESPAGDFTRVQYESLLKKAGRQDED